MAFQPFGPRFEIRSPLSPEAAKAAIRKRKKRWLDPKNGARGWIVGRFICLWWTPYNQQGPMLFGRMVDDASGTRITGHAGSDLNGAAAGLIVGIAMILLIWTMISSGQAPIVGGLFLGGMFAAIFALGFWARGFFHRDAEPLVRFVRKTLAARD